MIKRTKLIDRKLPNYSKNEEIANTLTHLVGVVFGAFALVYCIIYAFKRHDTYREVAAFAYGISLICLYLVSSIYHFSKPGMFKKVMQVIDHCTIYFLITGSYLPILFGPIRDNSVGLCWVLFGVVCALSIIATVFTAIDLNKYDKLSMICYLGIGWLSVFWLKTIIKALSVKGFVYLLMGGIAYTVGAIFYRLGGKANIRYMHSIFHLFVLLGTFLQFISIFHFCILY